MLNRSLVVGGIAAGVLSLLPATAIADTAWFQDQHGDVRSSVDVHRLRVINGTPDRPAVRITVVQRDLLGGDNFSLWIDTAPGNPGPEYKVGWIANSDALGISRVDTFHEVGTAVHCPAFRVHSDQDNPREASHVLVPRGCLHYPDKVRVSLRAQRDNGRRLVRDWAPRPLHFYAWVAQG